MRSTKALGGRDCSPAHNGGVGAEFASLTGQRAVRGEAHAGALAIDQEAAFAERIVSGGGPVLQLKPARAPFAHCRTDERPGALRVPLTQRVLSQRGRAHPSLRSFGAESVLEHTGQPIRAIGASRAYFALPASSQALVVIRKGLLAKLPARAIVIVDTDSSYS